MHLQMCKDLEDVHSTFFDYGFTIWIQKWDIQRMHVYYLVLNI